MSECLEHLDKALRSLLASCKLHANRKMAEALCKVSGLTYKRECESVPKIAEKQIVQEDTFIKSLRKFLRCMKSALDELEERVIYGYPEVVE